MHRDSPYRDGDIVVGLHRCRRRRRRQIGSGVITATEETSHRDVAGLPDGIVREAALLRVELQSQTEKSQRKGPVRGPTRGRVLADDRPPEGPQEHQNTHTHKPADTAYPQVKRMDANAGKPANSRKRTGCRSRCTSTAQPGRPAPLRRMRRPSGQTTRCRAGRPAIRASRWRTDSSAPRLSQPGRRR